MPDIVSLNPVEPTPEDLSRLLKLGREPAGGGPSAVIERRLERLAKALLRASVALRDDRPSGVAEAACDAARLARGLGLRRAFRVAQATAALAGSPDRTALAANVARLVRLGDQAVTCIWEEADHSSGA